MQPCICGHDKYVHLHGADNNEFCGKCKCLDFSPVGTVKVKVATKAIELSATERNAVIQMCKKFIDRGGFDQDILFDIMEKMK